MNFGIIGTNFISDRFVEAARMTEGASPLAIYSRGEETARTFAERHGIKRTYTSLDAMLCDPDIDAIYVASPTMLHAEHTIAALRHGKHVLCEKMLAANLSEGEEMKREAEKAGLVLIEAMRPDFDKNIQYAVNSIASLGKIDHASLEFCQRSSRYDAFLHGDTPNAFNKDMKNSALSDIGIYPLHTALLLFGIPRGYSATGTLLRGGFLGEGSIVLDYGDFSATVNYSKITEGENVSVIKGERGTVRIGRINEPEFFEMIFSTGSLFRVPKAPQESNMANEIKEFIRLCEDPRGMERSARLLSLSIEALRIADGVHKMLGFDF